METRICKRCGKELPLSEFGSNLHSRDGISKICKDCNSKAHSRKGDISIPEATVTKVLTTVSRERLLDELRKRGELPIERFTPTDLMGELYRKGYKGKLEYTEVHIIDISKVAEDRAI